MSSMLDRGDSYRVQYLGCDMLSQMATGLGVLQKPLKNMYIQYRQACMRAPVPLQERHLMMTDRGMVMTSPQDAAGGRDVTGSPVMEERFHAMPSILLWDAIQFVVVKGHDKKLRAAFEPLDNDHSRNKDNLFSVLDKQYKFLQDQPHPPLFTCVLRRTQGVKALDVHAFVCYSDDEALGLVRALNTVHNNYSTEEQQETGVFGYNPFGNESVRSTAGLERAFGQQAAAPTPVRGDPPQADPHLQRQFMLRHQGGDGHDLQSRRNATPVAAADRYSRSKSPGRKPPSELSNFTGSQPNLSALRQNSLSVASPGASDREQRAAVSGQRISHTQSLRSSKQQGASRVGQSQSVRGPQLQDQPGDRNSRVFHLAQSDFALNTVGKETPVPAPRKKRDKQKSESKPDTGGESYDYLQHINRTLERPKAEEAKTQPPAISAGSPSPHAARRSPSSARGQPSPRSDSRKAQPRTSVKQQAFSSGGIFVEDKNFGKDSQRSVKGMGQGYSLLSSSQGPPPGYAPHQSSHQPYAPSPTEESDRSPSPTYQHTIPRHRDRQNNPLAQDDGTSVAQAYENITKFIAERGAPERQERQSRLPNGYPMPVVPPRSPRLDRSEPAHHQNSERPPATKQGTVMAQVTPQSQRLSNVGPFSNNRQSPGFSSEPSSQNTDNPGSAVSPSNPYSKPVAMVPPHKVQGIRVLPTKQSIPAFDKRTSPLDMSPRAGLDGTRSPDGSWNRTNSAYSDDSGRSVPGKASYSAYVGSPDPSPSPATDVYAVPRKGSQKVSKSKQKSKTDSPSNWQFQKTPTKPDPSSQKTSSGSRPDKPQTENLLANHKKDAEIAAVVQNIHFDYEGTMAPHAPHGTNFEKSLGYFP